LGILVLLSRSKGQGVSAATALALLSCLLNAKQSDILTLLSSYFYSSYTLFGFTGAAAEIAEIIFVI